MISAWPGSPSLPIVIPPTIVRVPRELPEEGGGAAGEGKVFGGAGWGCGLLSTAEAAVNGWRVLAAAGELNGIAREPATSCAAASKISDECSTTSAAFGGAWFSSLAIEGGGCSYRTS